MPDISPQEAIKQYAELHIKTTREIMGIELGFDEASIMKLDEIISNAWPEEPPTMLENVVTLFGSFLGEAIRATIGGEWVEKDGSWVIEIQAKSGDTVTANPFAKVNKRFVNGTEDSISYYYQMIKKGVNEGFEFSNK